MFGKPNLIRRPYFLAAIFASFWLLRSIHSARLLMLRSLYRKAVSRSRLVRSIRKRSFPVLTKSVYGGRCRCYRKSGFELQARSVLEEKIAQKPIECVIKIRNQNDISAQCVNHAEEDLSLYMLQQGYVVVNRELVYGSIYENPYIEAEKSAQRQSKGLWSLNHEKGSGSRFENDNPFILGV